MIEPQPVFEEESLINSLIREQCIPETHVNRVWVVGSLVNPEEEVDDNSDVDIYIQLDDAQLAERFDYRVHSTSLQVLVHGERRTLPLDISMALKPGEEPNAARGRPVYELDGW